MAQQPNTHPISEQVDEYTNIIENLLIELDISYKKRIEAHNKHQVNLGRALELSPPGLPLTRAQAVQCVREAIKDLGPLEVAIVYDNAQSFEKMNKEYLCGISRYFANALDGPFKEANTRIIRLRHDFPWAVYTMLDFLKNGSYYMYPLLQAQYPRITMLDLHIHCYIIADKYDILALADFAATSYLRIAAETLSLDWQFDDPDYYDGSLNLPCVEYLPYDMCSAAEVSRVLDSVVLLWKNTASRQDRLRKKVLDMIKSCFIKLMRLKSFQFLFYNFNDFLLDLVESFGEDGVEITFMAKKDEQYEVTFEV